jgi:hypothetical protein
MILFEIIAVLYKVVEDMTAFSFEMSVHTYQSTRRYTVDEDSSNSLPWSESLKIFSFSVSTSLGHSFYSAHPFLSCRFVFLYPLFFTSLFASIFPVFLHFSVSIYIKLHCESSNGK